MTGRDIIKMTVHFDKSPVLTRFVLSDYGFYLTHKKCDVRMTCFGLVNFGMPNSKLPVHFDSSPVLTDLGSHSEL